MKKSLLTTLLLASLLTFVSAETQTGDQAPGDDITTTSSDEKVCYDLKKNLGSKNLGTYRNSDRYTNNEVTKLQNFLQDYSFLNVEATGYFGMKTRAAVKSFQSSVNVLSSGYVGPITRAKIKGMSCDGGGVQVSNPVVSVCTMEARQCPDGSYVSRSGPSCSFGVCPVTSFTTGSTVAPNTATTLSPFSTESLAARLQLASDWNKMFDGSTLQNTGSTMSWAGGTLTRLANGSLLFNPGNYGETKEFNQSYNPQLLAQKYDQVNYQWGVQYGINVAGGESARLGAYAVQVNHIFIYGVSSAFTEANPFQIGNSASGAVGVYRDLAGVLMFKTNGGNMTQSQFMQSNYFRSLADGGTPTGSEQSTRVWPTITVPPITTTSTTSY